MGRGSKPLIVSACIDRVFCGERRQTLTGYALVQAYAVKTGGCLTAEEFYNQRFNVFQRDFARFRVTIGEKFVDFLSLLFFAASRFLREANNAHCPLERHSTNVSVRSESSEIGREYSKGFIWSRHTVRISARVV